MNSTNILEELRKIKFPTNKSRKNIGMSTSFCLGDVNYRGQKALNYKTRGESKYNQKFPDLFTECKNYMKENHPKFTWTTIQVNKNVYCPPHVDKNNVGPSFIIGLGDYTGGEVNIEGKTFDIRNGLFFSGLDTHWSEPFQGERYSLVFFTHTFKPPHPKWRGLTFKKDGIYKNGILLKSF